MPCEPAIALNVNLIFPLLYRLVLGYVVRLLYLLE